MSRLVVSLAALLLTASSACAESAPPSPAWVQYTDDGGVEARALAVDGRCPAANLDGQPAPMNLRMAADADFPAVCVLAPPSSARSLTVAGQALPLPHAVNRIVMFGDTGCRLKGEKAQACNNLNAWPFRTVAGLAADRHPDLVVHLGDYYYRESPCPDPKKGCAPTPFGDRWASWDADFFAPSARLLSAAPWVMVRGNHEDCKRGGLGWSRLLSASRTAGPCSKVDKPYAVNAGGVSLAIVDSSSAKDMDPKPDDVARIAAQYAALQPLLAKGPAWLIAHHPIWSLVSAGDPLGMVNVSLDQTEQAAARRTDLAGVDLAIGGHVHHVAIYDFGRKRPSQLVIGSGGTLGSPKESSRVQRDNIVLDGEAAQSLSFYRWGYGLFERTGTDWTFTFFDVTDKPVVRCLIRGRDLQCGEVR